MTVFEVKSANLDINDSVFGSILFATIESAIVYCKQELESKCAKNIKEDLNGELKEFNGTSLEYVCSKNKPAIYYNSHFGNYNCVIFIETRNVY